MNEALFSYGTLREPDVQLAIFGRRIHGTSDAIVGFKLNPHVVCDENVIAISGRAQHTILEPSDDRRDEIEGVVFRLTASELAQADAYQDKAYKRIQVRLRSGIDAWVYVKA